MAVYLSALWGAGSQLFDSQGVVLAQGFIKTYIAGTTTPLATYTDNTGLVSNGVSIQLDAAGRPPNEIWLTGGQAYKFILTDVNSVQVGGTYDNITGIGDPGTTGGTGVSEWSTFAGTPSYISATQFSVTGDQTARFPVGTRVKFTVTAGTGYGTVSAVAFTTFTTVTLINDGTTLDNGLSAVATSINPVVGKNVSAASVDYKPSLSYPSGTVGAALNGLGKATTTAGTSTAYTLTPPVPITSYVSGQAWLVNFNQASGASPTLNVSSVGPIALKQYNSSGTKIAAVLVASQISNVVYDGTDMVVIDSIVTGGGQLLRITQVLTTGTWTRGAGTTKVLVRGVGGGGGGGGSGGSGDAGGGGGGGAGFELFLSTPGATEAVTIGAGGASLGNGGLTSFGAWVSAEGGKAGAGRAGGAGGVIVAGANIGYIGQGGGFGASNSESAFGGSGGSSFLGGGAAATTGHAATGVAASANSGGGGSGGVTSGGAGGSGIVNIYEYS